LTFAVSAERLACSDGCDAVPAGIYPIHRGVLGS
jgi:hypothetical protein